MRMSLSLLLVSLCIYFMPTYLYKYALYINYILYSIIHICTASSSASSLNSKAKMADHQRIARELDDRDADWLLKLPYFIHRYSIRLTITLRIYSVIYADYCAMKICLHCSIRDVQYHYRIIIIT